MEKIKKNLEIIKNKIAEAADKSGRRESDVTLIGVTKTIDAERINQLIQLGVTQLGENRVQELTEKYPLVNDGVKWHLIGNLQKNKIKYIIDKIALIQSVESIDMAVNIDKAAKKHEITMDVLLEVNIADEISKHGVTPEQAVKIARGLTEIENIRLRGLMTVAPFVENPELNRDYFKKMFTLYVDIKDKIVNNNDINILSMGMTGDYTIAIEEGATMVRIGTGIFGERDL